jgi:hypothetical protein
LTAAGHRWIAGLSGVFDVDEIDFEAGQTRRGCTQRHQAPERDFRCLSFEAHLSSRWTVHSPWICRAIAISDGLRVPLAGATVPVDTQGVSGRGQYSRMTKVDRLATWRGIDVRRAGGNNRGSSPNDVSAQELPMSLTTPAARRDLSFHLHPSTNLRAVQAEGPLVITRGEGVYVYDDEGKRYLEGMAGLWCASLGFSERRLAEAAYRQMCELPFYHSFGGKVPRSARSSRSG